jgi:outer membrane murein-binding lipoprotein Lpp
MKRISTFICTTGLCLPLILAGCDKGAEERAKLQQVEQELVQLKTTIEKTSSERDDLKTKLAAATKERDDLQTQVTGLTAEEEKLRNQIEDLTSSSQGLDEQVTKLTGTIEKLTEQIRAITESRDQLQKEIADLKSSRDSLQAQLKELEKQRDEAIAKEKQAQRELAMLRAKAKAGDQAGSKPSEGPVAVTEPPTEKETTKVEQAKLPIVHSFASARSRVDKGQSATLTWHVSNASEIRIEPGIGSVSALGSTNVKPAEDTTYTLTATNGDGQTVETYRIEVR